MDQKELFLEHMHIEYIKFVRMGLTSHDIWQMLDFLEPELLKDLQNYIHYMEMAKLQAWASAA